MILDHSPRAVVWEHLRPIPPSDTWMVHYVDLPTCAPYQILMAGGDDLLPVRTWVNEAFYPSSRPLRVYHLRARDHQLEVMRTLYDHLGRNMNGTVFTSMEEYQ